MSASGARRAIGVFLLLPGIITGVIVESTALAQRPSLRQESAAEDRASNESDRSDSRRKARDERRRTADAGTSGKTEKPAAKFAVESFSPRGPVTSGAVISVNFTADVTTTDALDTGKTPETIFSFEPSIEGALQWESLRQVRFIPARPLLKGTEYVVRINPLLKSVSGEALGKQPEYRFQTPALTLQSASQQQFTSDRRAVIGLTFSDTVRPADLVRHLTIRVGDEKIGWKPQSDVATAQIRIVTDPLSTGAVTLALEPGLKGVSGPLGLTNRVEKKVNLEFRMVATSIKATWLQGKPMLSVKFSSHPSTADAEKFVSIEPPVDNVHFNSGYQGDLNIHGDFLPEQRYTVHVKEGFESIHNRMLLQPAKLSAWMPPIVPFLELPESGGGHLSTKGRMKLRVLSAGITTVTVTARRVFDNNLVFYTLYHNGSYGVRTLGRKLIEKSYAVQNLPNKALITEVDLSELLGNEASGIYNFEIVGETPTQEPVSHAHGEYDYYSFQRNYLSADVQVNLSNLGIVTKQGQGEVMVYIAALDTAQPLPGINVRLYSERNQLLGEGQTDAQGTVFIRDLAVGTEDAEPAVVIAERPEAQEVSVLNIQESLSGLEQFDSTGRKFLRDGYEVFITSERGAYRPGETAHISGFIRGRDGAMPDSAFPLEVVLQRPDGKKLTPEIKTPTETGLLNFDITVPAYAPTGYYTVDVRMPGAGDDEEEEYGDY